MNRPSRVPSKSAAVLLAVAVTFATSFLITVTTSAAPVQSGGTASDAFLAQTPTATTASPTATPAQCSDAVDNDGDGKIDHPADPGCQNPNDTSESPDPTPPTATPTPTPSPGAAQCEDGVDNDGDGKIDHPADPGCENPKDTTESPDPTPAPTPSPTPTGGGGEDTFVASAVSIRHRVTPRHVFKGGVAAGLPRCEPGRRVVVKKVRDGRDLIVGRDRTNDRGKWRVPHDVGGRGRYYAVATRRALDAPGDRMIICRRDRSATIRVRR